MKVDNKALGRVEPEQTSALAQELCRSEDIKHTSASDDRPNVFSVIFRQKQLTDTKATNIRVW